MIARMVSGIGYGYVVARDHGSAYWTVTLCFHFRTRACHGLSFDAATTMGERFAHVCREWQAVQDRARALAHGTAVIGGTR